MFWVHQVYRSAKKPRAHTVTFQHLTANFENAPRQKYLILCKAVDCAEQTSCILYDQRVSFNKSQRSTKKTSVSAYVMFGHERLLPSRCRLEKKIDGPWRPQITIKDHRAYISIVYAWRSSPRIFRVIRCFLEIWGPMCYQRYQLLQSDQLSDK